MKLNYLFITFHDNDFNDLMVWLGQTILHDFLSGTVNVSQLPEQIQMFLEEYCKKSLDASLTDYLTERLVCETDISEIADYIEKHWCSSEIMAKTGFRENEPEKWLSEVDKLWCNSEVLLLQFCSNDSGTPLYYGSSYVII